MKNLISLTKIMLLIFLIISCSKESQAKVESLMGSWELIGYFDDTSGQIDSEGYENEPVTIAFSKVSFEGNTSRNYFFGVYETNSLILIIDDINTTEINESNWGMRFMNSLKEAYDDSTNDYILKYSIQDGNLVIEYNSGHFMKLKRP